MLCWLRVLGGGVGAHEAAVRADEVGEEEPVSNYAVVVEAIVYSCVLLCETNLLASLRTLSLLSVHSSWA